MTSSTAKGCVNCAADDHDTKDCPRLGQLVDRFLSWPLPENLRSDNCATMPCYPNRTGTNLMNASEARSMLEYVLEPQASADHSGDADDMVEQPSAAQSAPGERDAFEAAVALVNERGWSTSTDLARQIWDLCAAWQRAQSAPFDLAAFAKAAALEMEKHDFHGFEPVVYAVAELVLGKQSAPEHTTDFLCDDGELQNLLNWSVDMALGRCGQDGAMYWKELLDSVTARLGAQSAPVQAELPTNEELERLWDRHAGHPADFAADVLERWGGWQEGLLGYGGALAAQSEPAGAVPEGWIKALDEAVSAIYFDDDSDFQSALWGVVRNLAPELAEELEANPSAAWNKAQNMLAAAPQPAVPEQGAPICPNCDGSGEVEVWSDSSPDAHLTQADCPHCLGSGDLESAYRALVDQLAASRSSYTDLAGELYFLKHGAQPAARQEQGDEVRRLREALQVIAAGAILHIERSDRPDLPTIGRWADTADAALSASAEGKA